MRRMNRTELIEIIYALQQNEKTLREQNEALQRQLDDRLLRLEQAGSIAEASLSLNHIFEDAQQAAAQYLSSLELANDQAQQRLAQADARLAEAQAQAGQIEADCQARLAGRKPPPKPGWLRRRRTTRPGWPRRRSSPGRRTPPSAAASGGRWRSTPAWPGICGRTYGNRGWSRRMYAHRARSAGAFDFSRRGGRV